jgi:aryl-alcohol dehydrogenase-like predicted oxidoreductase
MKYRRLGKTGFEVSEVSFGAWAIGGTWGPVDDEISMKALESAIDNGINFFDTADVYGDGKSEALIRQLSARQKDKIYIATKVGRKLDPHDTGGYNVPNIRQFVEASLKNLKVDCIDLLQLHCPPSEVYDEDYFFNALDSLVREGKIANLGVSVETVEEAKKALAYDNVHTIQVIFNMFRHKPAEELFELATAKDVGIIARVPLASGLLTGRMATDTRFDPEDHRAFNIDGAAFDKGETFSGVDFNKGLEAVEALRAIKPKDMTMAQFALRWILNHEAVSCVIPGGKTPEQVTQNAAASGFEPLSEGVMQDVKKIYDQYIRADVHHLW